MAWHNHVFGYVYFCRVKVQFIKNQLYFTHKMKTNHIAAMLLVRVLQEQVAKSKGMQYFLRTNYHMNGRYFQENYCSKTDLNHVSVMILGMAAKLSETQYLQGPAVLREQSRWTRHHLVVDQVRPECQEQDRTLSQSRQNHHPRRGKQESEGLHHASLFSGGLVQWQRQANHPCHPCHWPLHL